MIIITRTLRDDLYVFLQAEVTGLEIPTLQILAR